MPSHPVILARIDTVLYFMIFDPIPFFYALFAHFLVRLLELDPTTLYP
mgnify:FL=1|jgi:hypothetical protein